MKSLSPVCDKIVCIGKNYLDHAKEMGDSISEKPVLFLKPASSALQTMDYFSPLSVKLPLHHGEIHHECEIVLRIGNDLKIDALTLGLDMTLRDLQADLKKQGHPWEKSKVFAGSTLLGPWISFSQFENYLEVPFTFSLDGQEVQTGLGKNMRLNPNQCIEYASEFFPLCPGDIFFTGTPAGVGPVKENQVGDLRWGDKNILKVRWHSGLVELFSKTHS